MAVGAVHDCPGGTCHIVTRGAGDANFVANLWEQASDGTASLYPFFAPYDSRPGRDASWRDKEAGSMSMQGLLFFAPETPDDALAGDETAEFLSAAAWGACLDPSLPVLLPGDKTPLVMGIDASVSADCFAIVLVSRHPDRHDEPAIRMCKLWDPRASGGRIDFGAIERWILCVRFGGCNEMHPVNSPDPNCNLCRTNEVHKGLNVVNVVYDPYQMASLAQRLEQQIWVSSFDQARPAPSQTVNSISMFSVGGCPIMAIRSCKNMS